MRGVIGKVIAFGLVALGCIGAGVLTLMGSHAYNDYFNFWLGWGLIGFGLLVGGLGTLMVGLILIDERNRRRRAELHITPRPGPLGPAPPWGMSDIGRPGNIVQVSDALPRGGGGPRVMSVSVTHIDVPIVIGFLLIWTLVALVLMAPR
jgi:hypothetical protein